MSNQWIVENLQHALSIWNEKLSEIWQLLTLSPEEFKGGQIWKIMVDIHGSLQAVGYALLVLFFVTGLIRTCSSFTDVKKPEHVFKNFIRFALAKAGITYGLELMMGLFEVCQGIIGRIMEAAGLTSSGQTVLPPEILTAIDDCGFWESIPLAVITLLGGILVTVLSFVMIMTVYGRFFQIYMYVALAPIPLSFFAGEPTQRVGLSFVRSFLTVCLEGAAILLGCVIFSVFASSPPVVAADTSPVTQVWSYIGELIFNMLILVGTVKMSERIVRDMMGL